jgi:hypothetical protein
MKLPFSKPILIFLGVLFGLLLTGSIGLLVIRQYVTLGIYVGMITLIALGGTVGWKQETDQDHK